jgi:hypothetical protein
VDHSRIPPAILLTQGEDAAKLAKKKEREQRK